MKKPGSWLAKWRLLPWLLTLAGPLLLRADVTLPSLLASHMVLQRDQPIHVWGWAAAGESVSAEFQGSTQTVVADQLGHWSINLPPHGAGGPFTLTVKAANTIVLEDILVGDVWFASGQSNMEMPLNGFPGNAVVANATTEIQNSAHAQMRLFFVKHKATDYPQVDFPGSTWMPCTPQNAATFSAVAYFFGRALLEKENVPIGLVDSTWGGTPAEAWTSMQGLASDASLMPVFSTWAEFTRGYAEIDRTVAAEMRADSAARSAHQPPPHHKWHPEPASWGPAELFNGMVAPALNFHIKGVIWYQGETNSAPERAPLYSKVFPTLISDWRRLWQEGDFPFLFVQISSFDSEGENWGVVRDAQRRTLHLANTGMAVTIDIGDPQNVHPANKQDVGARLALAARAIAYGEALEYSGPLFRLAGAEGAAERVWFDHTGTQLVTSDGGQPKGFEIAGEDRHFVPADARLDGATVIVSSSAVAAPRYVRYAWANVPDANLFNSQHLPASTFTSEPELP